ncbi:MAG: hypothetical protein JWM98_3152 [Thermoleophilia bacterium]|nr:hypothetical protein [Thermoleophilia bacterium]
MQTFTIEQREPGNPIGQRLAWQLVARVEAPDAPAAIHAYCRHMGWLSVRYDHNVATVHGVGAFRAAALQVAEAAPEFVVQRQDPIGPDDVHLTWSDVATVRASDAASAIRAYCDGAGWSHAEVFANVAAVVGVGSFRAVPAELADELRVTP